MNEPTIQFADVVRHGAVALDDPAETYHEASRLYPSTVAAALPGLALIESDRAAYASTTRSSRRHPHREGIDLPRPRPLRAGLGRTLSRRISQPAARGTPLPLSAVSTILDAAYAARATPRGTRRAVPSAGALYPLELYAVCVRVAAAPPGLLHYDPFAHRLEQLDREDALAGLTAGLTDAAVLEHAALVLVVTAMPWRARFKYGDRGYRFALLEAGHVAQNALLACAALRLPALPIGGFFDRRIDAVVGANGIDEVSLYVLVVGGRERR